MTFVDDMNEAGKIYADRLDKQAETKRLAALALEANHQSNATAFAEAFEQALARTTDEEN